MGEEVTTSPRRVMIPIVVSDVDETTFKYYWKVIAAVQDVVLLVHIFSSKDATKEKWHDNQMQLKTVIAPFEEKCGKKKISYQLILHTGKPGEGICDMIQEHKPDLLIIGSRGLSKLRRTLETSVSEYVHHNAKVPILIVPYTWSNSIKSGDANSEA